MENKQFKISPEAHSPIEGMLFAINDLINASSRFQGIAASGRIDNETKDSIEGTTGDSICERLNTMIGDAFHAHSAMLWNEMEKTANIYNYETESE
jgi:hypothetical protein